MKITNILITDQSIPNPKNGSWTQRIEYLLQSSANNIDHVICYKSVLDFSTTSTFHYVNKTNSKLYKSIFKNRRFLEYNKVLKGILKNYNHLVICIIDNVKLLNTISKYVEENSLKNKITILFYNCGFSYFLNQEAHIKFTKNIDNIIFLTKSAYLFNKNMYNEFTPEVSILNNPINKKIFTRAFKNEENEIISRYKLKKKKVFLWLSHDRKKKGLSIILNAWKSWEQRNDNHILLVVGAKRKETITNVIFVGEVESKNVHKYYKVAHIYLFPTLWKEGFGLSLAQAICSGCYCIASDNGGVKDFFTDSDGFLIEEPNIINNWISGFNKAIYHLENGWVNSKLGNQILNFDEWSTQFSDIFYKWHKRLKI